MLLTIAFILIILGILFIILKSVFGVFPYNWELVGIALAGVGVAIAAPSMVQALWGRPCLKVEFERGVEDRKRFLAVFFINPPIHNKILRIMGVRRETIQSLAAQFRISEVGSGRIIVPIRQARIFSDDDPTGTGRDRIALPPTYSVAASCMIVIWDTEKSKAFILPDRLTQSLELSTGYYQADIILMVDGEPIKTSRRFVVGQKLDDLVWSNPD